jgi:C1A family cysteine protease
VPPAYPLDHVIARRAPGADALPARYDARSDGLVSPVKDQGACGSCYAFAAASDLESAVLAHEGLLVDVSENQLKECHFEQRSCNGGNATMVLNLLSRTGAALESCDPYQDADVDCDTTCPPAWSVRGWRWIHGTSTPDVAALKQALLDHGPLSTTVFAGDGSTPAWSDAFRHWDGGPGLHYTGSEPSNHAVVLVGWDDDQPHAGGGTGCWIVKNSWGTAWGSDCGSGGEAGYFHIAYGSASIGTWTSVITDVMSAYPELAVAGWDDGGWTSSYGFFSPTAWAMARFEASEVTNLHRVEFWTTDACTDVDVMVYDSLAGGLPTGELAAARDRTAPGAGYRSVRLAEPLALVPGEDYYVVVRFQTAGSTYPVALDGQGSHAPGQSWTSPDGSTWYDLSNEGSASAGIRIRTSPHTVLPVDDPGGPAPPQPRAGLQLQAPWPNPFNPSTTLSFRVPRGGPVALHVFDLQGRRLRTLLDGPVSAGEHRVRWDGRDGAGHPLPAGVYVARLDDGWQWRTRRLVLLK